MVHGMRKCSGLLQAAAFAVERTNSLKPLSILFIPFIRLSPIADVSTVQSAPETTPLYNNESVGHNLELGVWEGILEWAQDL